MKRILALLLSIMMIISLSACSESYDLSGLSEYEQIALQNTATLKNRINSDLFDVFDYIHVFKNNDKNFYITLIPYKNASDKVDLAIFKNNKFIINSSDVDNLDKTAQTNKEIQEILLFIDQGGLHDLSVDGYSNKLLKVGVIKDRLNMN